jgi:hypothetical protein
LRLKIVGLGSGSRFKYRLRFRLTSKVQAQGSRLKALDFKSRLRLQVLYPGSGSKLFEPRLGRLRLSVFEPVDNITYDIF